MEEISRIPAVDWRSELREAISLAKHSETFFPEGDSALSAIDAERERFPMLVPSSYANLIDWADPKDPLRLLVTPSANESSQDGREDTSGEALSTVAQGIQHKYEKTAVLVLTQACAAHCRYCFRRRILREDVVSRESINDLDGAIRYVAEHPEVDNVFLSGGDPMVSSTGRLKRLLVRLADISHVRQIRISTKLPAFLPSRFTSDPDLIVLLREMQERFQLIFQCHFDHARELRAETRAALDVLRQVGCLLTSQVALIKGVNDNSDTLAELFREMHLAGIAPQYLFHPRPVKHAVHFQIPIARGLAVVEGARQQLNGSAKRFRYVMTLEDGKLEIVGTLKLGGDTSLVVRWHQLRKGIAPRSMELIPINEDTMWVDRSSEAEERIPRE